MNVLGISGSLRTGSYNTALLHAAAGLVPEGMQIEVADIRAVPIYDDDVAAAGMPAPVAALRAKIAKADAVLIVSPEYNRSVPGMLKNAIDWISRPPSQPFDQKPVAIMGCSRGALGAAFANHHLRQILVYMDAQMVNGPEILVGEAPRKFSESGALTDQPTRDFVARHLVKFQGLIEQMRR